MSSSANSIDASIQMDGTKLRHASNGEIALATEMCVDNMAALETLIKTCLVRFPNLRVAEPRDWPRVIDLECELFPSLDALFSTPFLERISVRFQYYLFVAIRDGTPCGYLSMLPLNRRGVLFCEMRNVKSVGVLDDTMFSFDLKDCSGAFLEVLAFAPDVPIHMRRGLHYILTKMLRFYNAVPVLASPASPVGRDILVKRGFAPIGRGGLNELYVR